MSSHLNFIDELVTTIGLSIVFFERYLEDVMIEEKCSINTNYCIFYSNCFQYHI